MADVKIWGSNSKYINYPVLPHWLDELVSVLQKDKNIKAMTNYTYKITSLPHRIKYVNNIEYEWRKPEDIVHIFNSVGEGSNFISITVLFIINWYTWYH